MKTKSILIAAAALTLSACAPVISGAMNAGTSSEDVRTKTAKYFGTEVENIEFGEIKSGLLHKGYTVTYQDVFYNCRVYYGEVECISPTGK